MLEITNIGQVIDQLDQWDQDVRELTRQVAFGMAVTLYKAILTRSAQYSGDYAANWKFTIGKPDYSFTHNVLPTRTESGIDQWHTKLLGFDPHRKAGDGEAIAYAKSHVTANVGAYKLGETLYISNSAFHDEPYAVLIEENKIKFRPGNQGSTVSRALDFMNSFTLLSSQDAQRFRREKL